MAKSSKIFVLMILWLSLLANIFINSTHAVGVHPLIIDIDAIPGEICEFKLVLTPSDLEETVNISFYQPVQILNGSLVYEEADIGQFPAAGWVSLDANRVKVYPGGDTVINGMVRVPFSAGGSHTVVIMVEPEPPESQSGISFVIRYAIRLNIRIDRPGLRLSAQLADYGLVPGEYQEPLVQARLHNTSAWDYVVTGEATLRDHNRHLVERVVLNAATAVSFGMDSTRVYPGAMVDFFGEITRRLDPGEYQLRVFLRYGDTGQIVKNETIIVEEGQYNFPKADALGAFSLNEEKIEIDLRSGSRRSQAVQLVNELGEPIIVTTELVEVEPGYDYSVVDWIEVLAGTRMEIISRGRSRLAFTIAVPREAESGSYHGYLLLKAYSKSTGKFINERLLPVQVLVGDDHNAEVVVRSFAGGLLEDGCYLWVDIENSGNIPIEPQIHIVAFNQEGEFVQRGVLTVPEVVDKVLPQKAQVLDGFIDLEPGTYDIEISVLHQNVEILILNEKLQIK